MKDRLPLYLLICIPAASVVMGFVILFFALQGPPQEIPLDGTPLSKTSWQHESETGSAPGNGRETEETDR